MTTIEQVDDLRPGWWMTLRAWLDENGRNVWFQHDCTEGRVTAMEPYPTWQALDGRVVPSFHCRKCDLHAFVHHLSDPPALRGKG